MSDFDRFQIGGTFQPLQASTANSILRDADPALFYALDFWTFVVNQYVGKRLVAAAALVGAPISSPVVQAYPVDPTPTLLENQAQFPAIFAYRTRTQTEQWTVGFDHDICGVTFEYVLPPLDQGAYEAIVPILKAVYDAIRLKTNDGWDPAYTPPGGVQGEQWLGDQFAKLQEVGFGLPTTKRVMNVDVGADYGHRPGTGNLRFPCLTMRGYFVERDQPRHGPQYGTSAFGGADITGNVKADDGTVVQATASTVSQGGTQLAPTISSLSIKTGPATGGTSVTIAGALFLQGPPVVYFGPASDPTYATSVTYNSTTSLTIVTPAMQGAGKVDLTVVNRDGQSGTLAGAFTFT